MFSINQIVNPSFLSGWVLIDLIGLIDFNLISLVFLSHTSEATRASTVLWGSINKYGNSGRHESARVFITGANLNFKE